MVNSGIGIGLLGGNRVQPPGQTLQLNDCVALEFGTDSDIALSFNNTTFLWNGNGTLQFQEATTFSTSEGDITVSPASELNLTTTIRVSGSMIFNTLAPRIDDDITLDFGICSDSRILNMSTTLSADAEITSIIEGNSNHQGVAANSLIISNRTDDGDIMMLISDGGNSLEMLKFTAATAEASFGWGALKVGFGLDVAAITRPASVCACSASIITALVNLGLFTA